MDEIASPTEADSPQSALAAAGGSAKGPVRAYGPAVLSERQPKVTELLPVRPLLFLTLVLLGLTGIAAIEAIHIHVVTLPQSEGAVYLKSLDVRERGSLAAWYSSALLAGAVGLALVIFGIRAHRVDDYRGRYRIWLWASVALAWLSLDAATAVHDAIGLVLTLLAGKQALGGNLNAICALTWIVLYGVLFGTLGLRLAIEVWSSLASFAMLALAGLLYVVSGLMELRLLAIDMPLVSAVAQSTIAMAAHVTLAAAIGLYARQVYLDAQGRLKVHIDPDQKKPKNKSRAKLKVVKSDKSADDVEPSKTAVAAKPSGGIRFGGSNPAPSGPLAKAGASISKAELSSQDADDEDEEDDEDAGFGGQQLSKSERRRLKKLARRDQQRRAA